MTTTTTTTAAQRADAAEKAAAKREEARMEALAYERRSRELTLALMATLRVVLQQAGMVAPHQKRVSAMLAEAEALVQDKESA
jgi:hypothetical protein